MEDAVEQEKKHWSFALRPTLGSEERISPTLLRWWGGETGDDLWMSYNDRRNSYNLQFRKPVWNWGKSGWNRKGFLKRPLGQLKLNFYGGPNGSASEEVGDFAVYHFEYIFIALGAATPGSKSKVLMNNVAESTLITLTHGTDVIFSFITEIPPSDFQRFVGMIENHGKSV